MKKVEVGNQEMQARFGEAGTTAEVDSVSGHVVLSNWPKARFIGSPSFLRDMLASPLSPSGTRCEEE